MERPAASAGMGTGSGLYLYGEVLLTGPLDPGGAPVKIELQEPTELSGFTVDFLQTEGEQAGLCEMEAYSGSEQMPGFIKLMDSNENFFYTYRPEDESTIGLKLYASNLELKEKAENAPENFIVTANGVPLENKNNTFLLPCPGTQITIRAQLKTDPSVYDEIIVRPYSSLRTCLVPLLKPLDMIACGFLTYTGYYLSHVENGLMRLLGFL